MKKYVACFATIISFYTLVAQQNDNVVINPVKQNQEELNKKIYKYPDFVTGKAVYKDGSETSSLLNYNYLNNQVFFITPKADTLQLTNCEDFSRIVMGSDTFCYCNKMFVQQLTHHPSYNLFVKRSLENKGSEKKGAYGTYSSTAGISPVNQIAIDKSRPVNLATDENITFAFNDHYYVSAKFNSFFPATKKGLYSLFGKNEKELKDFIEKNETNINKKEDLEKLLDYMRTIVK